MNATQQYAKTWALRHPARARESKKRLREKYKAANTPEAIAFYRATHGPKACAVCNVTKPLSEYRNDASMKSGIDTICKACRSSLERAQRAQRKEKRAAARAIDAAMAA